jgi:lysine biosynthesis protein LysW
MRIDTEWGMVEIGNVPLELGEVLVTDDGIEIEVTGLEPLVFTEATMEQEDWGE